MVVTKHGVEGNNHLAHHGNDDDFWGRGRAWLRRMSAYRMVAEITRVWEARFAPKADVDGAVGVLIGPEGRRMLP